MVKRFKNHALRKALEPLKDELTRSEKVLIKLSKRFGFKNNDIMDFDQVLEIFNWDLHDSHVDLDFRRCTSADYQAISLLVIYSWYLKSRNCTVTFNTIKQANEHASVMWRNIGGHGTFNILYDHDQQFRFNRNKPLYALRKSKNSKDFKKILEGVDNYISEFDISYIKTLRYILSELMYNTLEHGHCYATNLKLDIPSLVQMNWYQKKETIDFIIADVGIGIKEHLEQAYPSLENDEEAIKLAIQPEKSGTFNDNSPYKTGNNAGMGLFLSSNIIKNLKGELYILSGNGLVHISPTDMTSRTLKNYWKGTLVFLSINIRKNTKTDLDKILQDLRSQAATERSLRKKESHEETFVLHMSNFFGDYAEVKQDAINIRDKYLIPKINEGKRIIIDCKNIQSAPHSFLNALLANPIKILGLTAYKKIKIVNAATDIRETLDFIFEDNTS